MSDGNYECRYNKNVPCAWGAVKALRALVEVPPDVRSAALEGAVRKTAEFLASGDLAHGDHPTPRGKISDHWFRAPGFLLGACLVWVMWVRLAEAETNERSELA